MWNYGNLSKIETTKWEMKKNKDDDEMMTSPDETKQIGSREENLAEHNDN